MYYVEILSPKLKSTFMSSNEANIDINPSTRYAILSQLSEGDVENSRNVWFGASESIK